MRAFLALLLFFSTFSTSAGGYTFPNVQYGSAKLFLFNIFLEDESQFDSYIYKNGKYANSKIGDGYDLKPEILDQIHEVIAKGVDELIVGLSKCYIPRHGIIYFDEGGSPVASLSVCFECEQISIWSDNEINFGEPDYENFDIDKAEAQMKKWRDLFKLSGALVSDTSGSQPYQTLAMIDQKFRHNGQNMIQDPNLEAKFPQKYSYDEVKKWVVSSGNYELAEDVNVEISAGGAEYKFKELVGKDGTNFLFSSDADDCFLVEAEIYNSAIILPYGISVGMSFEQIQNSLGIWDGISNPASITVMGDGIRITYKFKYHSLTSIKIVLPT